MSHFSVFWILAVSVLGIGSLCGNEHWKDALQDTRAEGFEEWTSEQITGYAMMNADAVKASSYTKGILLLWINKEFRELELLWWKSEDSRKRGLILACFYALTDEDGDFRKSPNWPRFFHNSERFGAEKKKRLKELDDAKRIDDLLKKSLVKTVATLRLDLANR